MSKGISRRDFIGATASVAAGITIVPISDGKNIWADCPSDKLNIAGNRCRRYGKA